MRDSLSSSRELAGKKILFANFPADGHFNPLTGLAAYLKDKGADTRWYTSAYYGEKLRKLGIPHYPFRKAVDVNAGNFDAVFPERAKKKSQIARLKYDMIHAFILRAPEYYEDIRDIYDEFPFDILIADNAFTGTPFIKELMNIPVISIGVMPLTETSKDLPPAGLGMTPSSSFFGKIKQALLRRISDTLIFGEPNKVMLKMFDDYHIPHNRESLFDMMIRKSDLLLQSGTPGFEYYRSDLGRNIRFIGALLPHSNKQTGKTWFDERLNQYERVILVTQGTVEKDVNKIIVPTLEAFKNSGTLVIATTGGSGTEELKKAYPQENLIIEDFIPFGDVMPYTDVYITNGGYGGVMLGIENKVPQVVAGKHEGKNEICARVGYFKLGINLGTETPTSDQLKKAVEKILADDTYKQNVTKLAVEFARYDPRELCATYVADVLGKRKSGFRVNTEREEKIF